MIRRMAIEKARQPITKRRNDLAAIRKARQFQDGSDVEVGRVIEWWPM